MIRVYRIATPAGLGIRRRIGAAVAFDPISAGISAGVGLASAAIGSWMNSIQLSHDADTATTLIVNGLATQLQNLLNAYMAEPNPSCADQRAALDAYDQAWAWLQSPAACGNPSYGSAGNRCISDRAPNGEYPWQSYYRDPIANDPRLANAGCDTSQEILLPSLSTGTYAATGITAAGDLDTTTAPVTATPTSSTAAVATTTSNLLSNPALLVGAGLLAVLLLK
jgi:hypothetical protein